MAGNEDVEKKNFDSALMYTLQYVTIRASKLVQPRIQSLLKGKGKDLKIERLAQSAKQAEPNRAYNIKACLTKNRVAQKKSE